MDLLKPLVGRITSDLYQRRDGFWPHRFRRPLRESQYWSSGEIADLQRERLRSILVHAGTHNAFWRQRFADHGFDPASFRDFEDLRRLPVLTKEDIRTRLVHTFSDGYTREGTFARRTGGSTGTPLLVHHDFEAASVKRAAAERHNSWAHWDVGDRVAAVWGDVRALSAWKARVRNALSVRMSYLDTLRFDEERLNAYVDELCRRRHTVLYGHAHSIYRLAEFVRDAGRGVPPFSGVVTTSMVLSSGERRVIEEVFACRVFDRYGCHETSIIASECEAHDGLHVFAEGVYVEIDADPGRPGRVLLTDLLNRAMPLIRYEVGDHAVAATGECSCGRGLPRIREVQGRIADFLYTPDGRPVFGISVLDTFVIHIPGIRQLQIVQDRYDHLRFRVVRDSAFSPDTLAMLRWKVREVFGESMRFDLEFVEKIEQTRSGKYRFSICEIPDVDTVPC